MAKLQIRCLIPGDRFRFRSLDRTVTVVEVRPTGSVKFGQVGPDATPIMRVVVDGMPKPFAGAFEAAGDQEVEMVERRPRAKVTCHGCRAEIAPTAGDHCGSCWPCPICEGER